MPLNSDAGHRPKLGTGKREEEADEAPLRLQLFWFSKDFKPIKPFLFSFSLRGVANSEQIKTKQ
jgi:hypothetical protein